MLEDYGFNIIVIILRFNYFLKVNFSKMYCLYLVLYFYLSKVVEKDFIFLE